MSARTQDGYLPYGATSEARALLVEWLREQAAEAAVGSRDFGRGFAQAVETLGRAPVMCSCCDFPHVGGNVRQGDVVPCRVCGALWRVAVHGASWVPGGKPLDVNGELA